MVKARKLPLKKANLPDASFDSKQLKRGMRVEGEHSNDKQVQKGIAKAHLSEDKKYYKKLAKMESGKCGKAKRSK